MIFKWVTDKKIDYERVPETLKLLGGNNTIVFADDALKIPNIVEAATELSRHCKVELCSPLDTWVSMEIRKRASRQIVIVTKSNKANDFRALSFTVNDISSIEAATIDDEGFVYKDGKNIGNIYSRVWLDNAPIYDRKEFTRLRPAYKHIKEKFGDRFLIGAELGIYKGDNARCILNSELNINYYLMVDTFMTYPENQSSPLFFQELYENCKKEFFGYRNTHIIRAPTAETSKQFPDNFFDFVYVDASHTPKDVRSDATLWYPKVKKGGILCGHDYKDSIDNFVTVKQAIDEWVKEKGFKLYIEEDKYSLIYDWWVDK